MATVSGKRTPAQLTTILMLLSVMGSFFVTGVQANPSLPPPPHKHYLRLTEALVEYHTLQDSGQWRPISSGPLLKVGMSHPQVAELRHLLTLYRDHPRQLMTLKSTAVSESEEPPAPTDLTYFDSVLETSLAHFQRRHGKPPSEILDNKSRLLLNIKPAERIKQIVVNMKRWQELPPKLGKRYIWINLTDFRLQLVEENEPVLDMKVIIGKSRRRTPPMAVSLSSIILNPPWNVPPRITLREMLPKARQDPNFLRKQGIRVVDRWHNGQEIDLDSIDWTTVTADSFPYKLQQKASTGNTMGLVKFVIPNDFYIYLHDTNQPWLFKRSYRALSHGCVRLGKAMDLARELLSDVQGWDSTRINSVLAQGETTQVYLPEPIPTYLVYWTAWVDDRGTLQIRDDIYHRDRQALQEFTKSREKGSSKYSLID